MNDNNTEKPIETKKPTETSETKTPATPTKKDRRKPAPMHTLICATGENADHENIFKVLESAPKILSEAELTCAIEKQGPGSYVAIKGRIIPISCSVTAVTKVTIGG